LNAPVPYVRPLFKQKRYQVKRRIKRLLPGRSGRKVLHWVLWVSIYRQSKQNPFVFWENDNTVEWVLSFKLWCLNFYKLMSTHMLQYLSSCMVSDCLQVKYLLTDCNIFHHVWCLIVYKLISTHWPRYL
jgi:hypothetical protein